MKVKSGDGKIFSVNLEAINMSLTIKSMMEDLQIGSPKEVLTLPTVDSEVLKKVLEWCEEHKNDIKPESSNATAKDITQKSHKMYELIHWDKEFINSVKSVNESGQSMLFDLAIAANYLNILGLIDLTTMEIAKLMKDKTQEEIRDLFKVTHPDAKSKGPIKKINIQSSDGKTFLVNLDAAKMSVTIRTMLEDLDIEKDSDEEEIKDVLPIPNIDANVLQKVIDWCEEHKDDLEPEKENPTDKDGETTQEHTYELQGWDKEFISSVNSVNEFGQSMIFDLIIAANYLNIPGLNNLTITEVARMMKGKSQDEIRDLFKLSNDKLVSDEK